MCPPIFTSSFTPPLLLAPLLSSQLAVDPHLMEHRWTFQTHVGDVLLDALGQAEEKAVPLQHCEGVAGGIGTTLAFQNTLEEVLCPEGRFWGVRGQKWQTFLNYSCSQ